MRVAAKRGRTDVLERIGRVLLLGPAELVGVARDTMEAIDRAAPARKPEIYSIVARENDFFDVLLERFAPKIEGVTPMCVGSHGLGKDFSGWLDLQLDSPALKPWLAERGIEIGGGTRRACHWGVYNRPGALEFYAQILRERPQWSDRRDARRWCADRARATLGTSAPPASVVAATDRSSRAGSRLSQPGNLDTNSATCREVV